MIEYQQYFMEYQIILDQITNHLTVNETWASIH